MSTMNSNREKGGNPFWVFLSSIRLTILLLLILALFSVFGTFIPQQEEAMEFARRLNPSLARLFHSLQLFDMYHSVWFRFIIGALALNLVVCSVERFPQTLRLFGAPPRPDRSRPFENPSLVKAFQVDGSLTEIAGAIEGTLKRKYGKAERKASEGEEFLFVQNGRYSYFGVYFVHLSVLLILIGGIVGSFFGFEAFVNIPEGESADTVVERKGGIHRELPFDVRCDRFTVEFYEDGVPREYRSDLSFIVDKKVALRQSILVNHPVTFNGISFYQASYGSIPGKRARLALSRKGEGSGNTSLDVHVGQDVELPGGGGHLIVSDIKADFMTMGPALHLLIQPPAGEEKHLWVFKHWETIRQRFAGAFERFPKFDPESYPPYSFSLEEIETRYYTGLQVARDPGVPLVWAGCLLMISGFFITFFVSHRQIWIRLSKDQEDRVTVRIAGKANKNLTGMERELQQLFERLQAQFRLKRERP